MARSAFATVAKSAERRDEWLANAFRKIQEAAYDGQHGSAAYAVDRLALIQAIATTMLQHFEDTP